ncbi:MAG: D-2-hydroxyacid dehydrogenase [Phyllobacteriaceae bacterium]|nr:D-2-hydroxyacid dehydrogenase [Phyllobacteriaceae bacterium]
MAERPIRIVFLDAATLRPDTALAPFSFPHVLTRHDRTAPQETAARLAEADVALVNKVRIGAAEMDAAPHLGLIALAATGTDNVDLEAAKARGIVVANVRDYARATVPEHTFALILALRRSLLPYRASVLAGRWQAAAQFSYHDFPIADLAGATLGVVGSGSLGSRVAEIGRAFGMTPIFAARRSGSGGRPDAVPFPEFLARADVVSLHCPLTPETAGLFGAAEFAAMKPTALLINTARAGLVDVEALAEALERGEIAGAGLDVAAPEPPPAESPIMRLATRPNVILTPHVGWASREAVQGLADRLVANVEAWAAGTPTNRVA